MSLWNRIQLKLAAPKHRIKAIQALGKSGKETSVTPLMNCLDDSDIHVRTAAAKALGQLQSETALHLLIARLSNHRSEVRKTAAICLRYQGDTRARHPLSLLLKDRDPQVRTAAASSLRKLGWQASNREEQAAFDVASGHALAATFSGQAAVAPLLQTLTDQSSEVRRSAADALESINDARAVQPLINAANDSDPNVRVSAIHALSKASGQAIVFARLQSLARDPDRRVRLAAVEVLSKGAAASPLPLFIDLLSDSHYEIRLAAIQYLGRLQIPSLAMSLIPLLHDPDNDVRHASACALGELSASAAIESLVLTLCDEEGSVRQAAKRSLDKIDPDWGNNPAARNVADKAAALLKTRPEWVRGTAAPLLARLQEPRHPALKHSTPASHSKASSSTAPTILPFSIFQAEAKDDPQDNLFHKCSM